MHHINLVYCALFVLLVISGCGLFKPGATETDLETPVVKNWVPLETRTPDQIRIDSLADAPFSLPGNPLEVVQGLPEIRRVDTLLQENIHVPGQTDTIFTVFLAHSSLQLYKALDRSFLFHAQLMENILPINRGIRIGMTRKELNAVFPDLTPETHHIRVKSEYVEQYIDFYFQQDTLQQIEYQGYLD